MAIMSHILKEILFLPYEKAGYDVYNMVRVKVCGSCETNDTNDNITNEHFCGDSDLCQYSFSSIQ